METTEIPPSLAKTRELRKFDTRTSGWAPKAIGARSICYAVSYRIGSFYLRILTFYMRFLHSLHGFKMF